MSWSPGIGGTDGRPPDAMIRFRAVRPLPSTSRLHGEVILACPGRQSTPSFEYRSTESWGSIFAITSRTRCIIAEKSTLSLSARNPYSSARRIYDAILAERINALLGTQPVFRQSPPIRSLSISATFALDAAAI